MRRTPGAVGGDNVPGGCAGGAQMQRDLVVAQRKTEGQGRLLADPGAAIHFDIAKLGKLPQVEIGLSRLAVLGGGGDGSVLARRVRRQVEGHSRLGRFTNHHARRQQPLPFLAGERGQGTAQVFSRAGGEAYSGENGLPGCRGGVVVTAPDVPETRVDSTLGSSATQELLKCLGGHGYERSGYTSARSRVRISGKRAAARLRSCPPGSTGSRSVAAGMKAMAARNSWRVPKGSWEPWTKSAGVRSSGKKTVRICSGLSGGCSG